VFNWFKKKPTKDETVRASLAAKLKDYAAPVTEDVTDTTWTEITLDDGKRARVPKYTATPVEELTLTEFEEKAENVEVVGLDVPYDVWGVNKADTSQWHKAEKHGK